MTVWRRESGQTRARDNTTNFLSAGRWLAGWLAKSWYGTVFEPGPMTTRQTSFLQGWLAGKKLVRDRVQARTHDNTTNFLSAGVTGWQKVGTASFPPFFVLPPPQHTKGSKKTKQRQAKVIYRRTVYTVWKLRYSAKVQNQHLRYLLRKSADLAQTERNLGDSIGLLARKN